MPLNRMFRRSVHRNIGPPTEIPLELEGMTNNELPPESLQTLIKAYHIPNQRAVA